MAKLRIRDGAFVNTFSPKTEFGKGRLCMLVVAIFSSLSGQVSGGLFLTGYLAAYGLNIAQIAILNFIPSITLFFSIFSPYILKKYKHPKIILACGRIGYYTFNILSITLLPLVIKDMTLLMVSFIVSRFIAGIINAIFNPGYTAWHSNYLTDDVRANYFLWTQGINAFIAGIFSLSMALCLDSLQGEAQLHFMIIMRFVSYALAIGDVIVISIPKEIEYKSKTEKKLLTNLKDIFTIPVQNKAFLLTVVILCLYNFMMGITTGTLDYHLLQHVHASYTYQKAIDASYFLFFILFGTIWKKFIAKFTWFRAFAIVLFIRGITYITFGFVTEFNYPVLMTIVRLSQHVLGVVTNCIVASLPYVNLPDNDRGAYLVFHSLLATGAALLGNITETAFVKLFPETTVTINIFSTSFSFYSTSILLLACGFMHYLLIIFILSVLKIVTPNYSKLNLRNKVI